ncbi:phosphotransferase [Devosia sp. 2618]|uniref:phosphotransferase enzyme family protein n=1 Tax=Devosia sp. 2618 TaxID=3156454 RepID=UPI003391ADB6
MPITAVDVEPALSSWVGLDGSCVRLINHSENLIFRIDTPVLGSFVLRVHRPGYQSRASIESELAWLMALRRDTTLPISEPIIGRDGALLQSFETPHGERLAVLFRFAPGQEPSPHSDLDDLFRTLGGYAAELHDHVSAWTPPERFERQVWQAASILDPDGLWGDWRIAPGVENSHRLVLEELSDALRGQLKAYGTEADRYGLIHADMRLGNLLVDGDRVTLIDFDDCGFCWFMFDFAAAISFHETHAAVPALRAAWLEGYLAIRPLSAEDIAAMDAMVMLRRMALLAWIGSHAETVLAQQHTPGFADGTVQLAVRFLRGPIWS